MLIMCRYCAKNDTLCKQFHKKFSIKSIISKCLKFDSLSAVLLDFPLQETGFEKGTSQTIYSLL